MMALYSDKVVAGRLGRLIPKGKMMPSGENMEVQDELNQGQDGLTEDVNESLGVSDSDSEAPSSSQQDEANKSERIPSKETLAVQKRLKSQKRAHEREVRDLHARIGDLESRMSQPRSDSQQQSANPYQSPQPGSVEDHIHKAVSFALQQKDMEERKAKDAQQAAHISRKYEDFKKHLDTMDDKYDDFHDVVLHRDTPYTPSMRDYALTMPHSGPGSAGEVLYHLGKNPTELERISKLHPIDQAREMAALSHALVKGGEKKESSEPRQLGNIKSTPVNHSPNVTDKTPIGVIMERMKTGKWR